MMNEQDKETLERGLEMASAVKERGDDPDTIVATLSNALIALNQERQEFKQKAESSRERIFVARGGNMWGKGFTPIQAVEAALSAGGYSTSNKRERKYLTVYKLPPGAYSVGVDEMGTICWNLMYGVGHSDAEELPMEEWSR
jgi:hypothetical protein